MLYIADILVYYYFLHAQYAMFHRELNTNEESSILAYQYIQGSDWMFLSKKGKTHSRTPVAMFN